MKRQISICIILAIIVIILALLTIKINNESGTREIPMVDTEHHVVDTQEKTTQSVESSNPYKKYEFCAKTEDGRVVIYDVQSSVLYMETAIEIRFLSEELQAELKDGIYFENEEQLFDFLESYSS